MRGQRLRDLVQGTKADVTEENVQPPTSCYAAAVIRHCALLLSALNDDICGECRNRQV